MELARKIGAEWVVLDAYQFRLRYQRAIHENGLKVMVMDDYGHCEKWCTDLILNQNIGCEDREYDNEVPGAKGPPRSTLPLAPRILHGTRTAAPHPESRFTSSYSPLAALTRTMSRGKCSKH